MNCGTTDDDSQDDNQVDFCAIGKYQEAWVFSHMQNRISRGNVMQLGDIREFCFVVIRFVDDRAQPILKALTLHPGRQEPIAAPQPG